MVEFSDNTNEHTYLAKVVLHGQSSPVFIQMVLIDPSELTGMSAGVSTTDDECQATLPGLYEAIFEEGLPVRWRDEPWK